MTQSMGGEMKGWMDDTIHGWWNDGIDGCMTQFMECGYRWMDGWMVERHNSWIME